MRTLGILLIILSIFIGYISDSITNQIWFERAIGFSFGIFLYGIFILIKTSNCRFMRGVPNPPEHLRPKKISECLKDAEEASIRYNLRKERGITITRPEFPKDRT